MKRIFFNLIVCFSLATAISCNDASTDKDKDGVSDAIVPAEVKSAFSAKYSTATDVKWEDATEDSLNTYKAKFTFNGKKMKAEFDSKGNFVKEEEDN
jgi:hypothetical protein